MRPSPRRTILLVTERPGGPRLLQFLREEATRASAIALIVPAVRRIESMAIYPCDMGGVWLESPALMEADAARALTSATSRLAHLRWVLWEMGLEADGAVAVGDPLLQILSTFEELGCAQVAVASAGGRLEYWSARWLACRLARHVPTRLLDKRPVPEI